MYRVLLAFVCGCAAHAQVPTAQECTAFPIRSTIAMGPFQAPQDLGNAKVNATVLPPGWTPIGGSVGDGGAYVLACRPTPPTL